MSTGLTVFELKYLVSRNHKLKKFRIGVTRTWKYHVDIQTTFADGFKPFSGGYVRIEEPDDTAGADEELKIETFGKSEGYDVYPHPRDDEMIRQLHRWGQSEFDYPGPDVPLPCCK